MAGHPNLKEPRDGKPLHERVAIVYSPRYGISLGGLEKLHPFDIRKYDRIYDQLEEDGILSGEDVFVPAELTVAQIRSVHSEAFVESLQSSRTVAGYLEAPVIGLMPGPILERGVLRPFRIASGGTLVAANCALEYGIGINIGGGYHHAKPDRGEGFCVFADIPIAIRLLQIEGRIKRALVIDLDVHQGNGTIVCEADDPFTYCFSIHQKGIYPEPKEKGDLDVEIPSGTTDADYMKILRKHLSTALDRSDPDLVFVVAGCDTLEGDPLASTSMTPQGVAARDLFVVEACRKRKLPIVMTLGGGYSENAWRTQYLSIKGIIESAQ